MSYQRFYQHGSMIFSEAGKPPGFISTRMPQDPAATKPGGKIRPQARFLNFSTSFSSVNPQPS